LLFFLWREKKPRGRLILRGDSLTAAFNSGYMQELPALRIFTDFRPPEPGLGFLADGWRRALGKE
jgi:hypothetical protein